MGTTSEAKAEIKRLKKQIAELEKANEILRPASVFFALAEARSSDNWGHQTMGLFRIDGRPCRHLFRLVRVVWVLAVEVGKHVFA